MLTVPGGRWMCRTRCLGENESTREAPKERMIASALEQTPGSALSLGLRGRFINRTHERSVDDAALARGEEAPAWLTRLSFSALANDIMLFCCGDDPVVSSSVSPDAPKETVLAVGEIPQYQTGVVHCFCTLDSCECDDALFKEGEQA
mmetsp:Transcript_41693/g.73207  ORF Transcript_41693/g.73207 Transcript_41693/m.73207 type:complete len:148 (-) Transcript_41693:533-976(-)